MSTILTLVVTGRMPTFPVCPMSIIFTWFNVYLFYLILCLSFLPDPMSIFLLDLMSIFLIDPMSNLFTWSYVYIFIWFYVYLFLLVLCLSCLHEPISIFFNWSYFHLFYLILFLSFNWPYVYLFYLVLCLSFLLDLFTSSHVYIFSWSYVYLF